MTHCAIVVGGIVASATAQVMLKSASSYGLKSVQWFLFVGTSASLYLVAFGLYAIALKYIALSRLSPIMTIGVMILVVAAGLLLGERLHVKQYLGIVLGAASIFLMLGE
jgi:drug/metabolite transporter (DMT)-like permease